jgi:hypothetical protein
MSMSERLLLRRIKKFIPADATVLGVEVARCNPLGPMDEHTPVVLTDKYLLLVSTLRATTVITIVPFQEVLETWGRDGLRFIAYRDVARGADREVGLDFSRGHRDPNAFILRILDAMRPWMKPVPDAQP